MHPKVKTYLAKNLKWSADLKRLRSLCLAAGMEETFKWSFPVYTIDGKNVISIGAFKNHYGMWFFNGVFLKDKHKLLVNAQESTKAMRQIRFEIDTVIEDEILTEYILEAIANQRQGLIVKPAKPGEFTMSEVFQTELDKNMELRKAFERLTPGRRKEYSNHISSAKQAKTKLSRLEKIKPMILAGIGLNDKYKSC